jgi:hypothetical protein
VRRRVATLFIWGTALNRLGVRESSMDPEDVFASDSPVELDVIPRNRRSQIELVSNDPRRGQSLPRKRKLPPTAVPVHPPPENRSSGNFAADSLFSSSEDEASSDVVAISRDNLGTVHSVSSSSSPALGVHAFVTFEEWESVAIPQIESLLQIPIELRNEELRITLTHVFTHASVRAVDSVRTSCERLTEMGIASLAFMSAMDDYKEGHSVAIMRESRESFHSPMDPQLQRSFAALVVSHQLCDYILVGSSSVIIDVAIMAQVGAAIMGAIVLSCWPLYEAVPFGLQLWKAALGTASTLPLHPCHSRYVLRRIRSSVPLSVHAVSVDTIQALLKEELQVVRGSLPLVASIPRQRLQQLDGEWRRLILISGAPCISEYIEEWMRCGSILLPFCQTALEVSTWLSLLGSCHAAGYPLSKAMNIDLRHLFEFVQQNSRTDPRDKLWSNGVAFLEGRGPVW